MPRGCVSRPAFLLHRVFVEVLFWSRNTTSRPLRGHSHGDQLCYSSLNPSFISTISRVKLRPMCEFIPLIGWQVCEVSLWRDPSVFARVLCCECIFILLVFWVVSRGFRHERGFTCANLMFSRVSSVAFLAVALSCEGWSVPRKMHSALRWCLAATCFLLSSVQGKKVNLEDFRAWFF